VPNGGIGTYNGLTAHLLAGRGWKVHLLYCGADPGGRALDRAERRLRAAGIGFSSLDRFEPPAAYRVPGVHPCEDVDRSERVRLALQVLHETHHFGLIEFADWGGLGFRAVQAHRCGLAFADARMIVKLHGSTQWMREGNRQWIKDENELQLDFCERYAFENADVQASPSRSMLGYARQAGWNVGPDARVTPYPLPDPGDGPPPELPEGPPEVVFFGRLETRKGLEVFVQIARRLPPERRCRRGAGP
jgi:glycosyltransferase involved in cell wall biosynthesis